MHHTQPDWGRVLTRLPCGQAEVTAFQEECSKDLEAAEPIIAQAEAALNSLDKASLGELKSFGSPAAEVVAVVSAVMVLAAPGGKIPKAGPARLPALTWGCVRPRAHAQRRAPAQLRGTGMIGCPPAPLRPGCVAASQAASQSCSTGLG